MVALLLIRRGEEKPSGAHAGMQRQPPRSYISAVQSTVWSSQPGCSGPGDTSSKLNAQNSPCHGRGYTGGCWNLHLVTPTAGWRRGEWGRVRGYHVRDLDQKMRALRPSRSSLPLRGISAAKHKAHPVEGEPQGQRGASRGQGGRPRCLSHTGNWPPLSTQAPGQPCTPPGGGVWAHEYPSDRVEKWIRS